MRSKRGIIGAAVAIGAVIFAATPALAAVSVGGGSWAYGEGCCSVWSNYDHNSENHSSSVHGGPWVYSGCTKPGPWALASAEEGLYNEMYWDKGCKL
ncbi:MULTISPECIES: lactococcin 972 family bacteriocin [unclassified Streptomyces]|uniref:lactococcin 972 family bacteriocin n=1 Tax=unclassified Streptomyces TaxID=2593676 RepID=UPI0033B16B07|nr:lactococcin 972 family bacteriocin [Streptomyces sp. NBC_01653]WTD35733.1 lactococcin 972 family bacteriocin [Streptomyces sp. NBC_01643]WTD91143.1 lactococcin 972 family bacteriocin [Streptomyces sp. NBC_01637]